MCLAWCTFHTPEAVLATIFLVFSLWHYYKSMKRIHVRFKGGYESLLLQANQSGDPSKYGLGIYGSDINWDDVTSSTSNTWEGIKSSVKSSFASGLAATGIVVSREETKDVKETEMKEGLIDFDFKDIDLSGVELSSLIGEAEEAPKSHVETYMWTNFIPKGTKRKSVLPAQQKQWHRYYVVGHHGTFDFYRKKNDYLQNDNAINDIPLKLSNFDAIWSSAEGSFDSLNGRTNGAPVVTSEGGQASNALATNSQSEVRNALRHLITGSQDTKVREYLGTSARRPSHDGGSSSAEPSPARPRGISNDEGNKRSNQFAFHLMPHGIDHEQPHSVDSAASAGALALLSASTAGDAIEFRAETEGEYEMWLDFLRPYSPLEKAKRDGTPATFEDVLHEMLAEPSLEGRDHKVNFTTHRNVIEGKRLLFWLVDNEWCTEKIQAAKVLHCMIDRGLITCVSQTSLKTFKVAQFYRLQGMEVSPAKQPMPQQPPAKAIRPKPEEHPSDKHLSKAALENPEDFQVAISPPVQEAPMEFPSSDDVVTSSLLPKSDGQNRSSVLNSSDDDVEETRRRASSATLIAGWLLKRGRDNALGAPSWKRRYFVVMGSEMRYYRTQSDFERRSDPIKNRPIELKGYAVFSVRDNPCGIVLKPAKKSDQRRVWELQTESIAEQVTWVQQLRDVIRSANDSAF